MDTNTPHALRSIVYVSSAVWLLSEAELLAILQDARHDNNLHEITGVLLYNDGTFFQYIEGPADNLQKIYTKIRQSRQHRGIIELSTEEVDVRRFPEWYMGFFQPSKDEILRLSNRNWWNASAHLTPNDKPEGIELLEVFCQNATASLL